MTAVAIPRGFIAPLPVTKQTPSLMQQLSTKVSELIKTRWILVTLVGLLVTAISAVGFSAFMALTAVDAIGSGAIVGGAAALIAGLIAPKDVKALRVFTLNFLGILSDPFEFRGDYGAFINSVKAEVNACLIGKATPKTMRKDAVAIAEDLAYGPKLKDVISDATWTEIVKMIAAKNKELGKSVWNTTNVAAVKAFLDKYGEDRLFYFMRNYPEPFLKMDIEARNADKDKPEGFRAPIVSSPAQITGKTAEESTLALAKYLVDRPDTLKCAKGRAREQEKWDNNQFILNGPSKAEREAAKLIVKDKTSSKDAKEKAQKIVDWKKPTSEQRANAEKELNRITEDNATALKALSHCHKSKTGGKAAEADLNCFKNPEGEAIAYLLYQAYNLKLLRMKDKERTDAGQEPLTVLVNRAKAEFSELLGDPYRRAQAFAKKFEKEGADLVFVQECSDDLVRAMAERGFISTQREKINGVWKIRSKVGSIIFANTKTMKRKFDLLPYDVTDTKQKFPRAIFYRKGTNQPVYAKGIHGSSDNSGEARDEAASGIADFVSRKLLNAKFVLAGDTNVNNQDELEALGVILDTNGAHSTNVGDTVGKEREITPQKKVGEQSRAQKDIVATLKSSRISNVTVGFNAWQIAKGIFAPSIASIGSDHWVVGADVE